MLVAVTVELNSEDLFRVDRFHHDKHTAAIMDAIDDALGPLERYAVESGRQATLHDIEAIALVAAYPLRAADEPYFVTAAWDWYSEWEASPPWLKYPDDFLPPCRLCGRLVNDLVEAGNQLVCRECGDRWHADYAVHCRRKELAEAADDRAEAKIKAVA